MYCLSLINGTLFWYVSLIFEKNQSNNDLASNLKLRIQCPRTTCYQLMLLWINILYTIRPFDRFLVPIYIWNTYCKVSPSCLKHQASSLNSAYLDSWNFSYFFWFPVWCGRTFCYIETVGSIPLLQNVLYEDFQRCYYLVQSRVWSL